MEINDKGYIANYKDGKKVQKAGDGCIIVDIVENIQKIKILMLSLEMRIYWQLLKEAVLIIKK